MYSRLEDRTHLIGSRSAVDVILEFVTHRTTTFADTLRDVIDDFHC